MKPTAGTASRSKDSRMPSIVLFWTEVVFYVVNVIAFYGFLILPIGLNIRSRCDGMRGCVRRIQWSSIFPGLPVYPVDLSDGQWRDFRSSLPLLMLAMGGSFVMSRCYAVYLRVTNQEDRGRRVLIDLFYGVALLLVQHGMHSVIVIALLTVSYAIGRMTRGTRFRVPAAWGFGLLVILLKESYRVKRSYPFLNVLFDQRYGGMYSWHLPANFLVLRIISFACDDHWAALAVNGAKKEDAELALVNNRGTADLAKRNDSDGSFGKRQSSRPHGDYCFTNYVAYALYPPLYMAGPVMTYDAYMSYVRQPADSTGVFYYALRWAFCLFILESGLKNFPMFAVVSSGLFWELSPLEMAVAAYVLLKLMWLKFLLLWRFFRLWALVDGKQPPENMTRCMSNNCSLEQFWKGWHSSYNKWLVRYMYVPLGVWHDIEPKLLAWGLLNASFYLVEVAAKVIFHSEFIRSSGIPNGFLNIVSIISCSTYICVLIGVNMIGYAIGLSGASDTVEAMSSDEDMKEIVVVVLGAYYFLSVGVCIMRFLVRNGFTKD